MDKDDIAWFQTIDDNELRIADKILSKLNAIITPIGICCCAFIAGGELEAHSYVNSAIFGVVALALAYVHPWLIKHD